MNDFINKFQLANDKIVQRAHETIRDLNVQDCMISFKWSKEEAEYMVDQVYMTFHGDLEAHDYFEGKE